MSRAFTPTRQSLIVHREKRPEGEGCFGPSKDTQWKISSKANAVSFFVARAWGVHGKHESWPRRRIAQASEQRLQEHRAAITFVVFFR